MKYRPERLGNQIKEAVIQILSYEMKEALTTFYSITMVRMSQDLRHAKIYYSVYGTEEDKKITAKYFENNKKTIRMLLSGKIRVRFMPEIEFEFDDSFENAERIERILKDLKDKGEL